MPTALPITQVLTPFSPVDAKLVRFLEAHVLEAGERALKVRYVLDATLDRLRVPAASTSRQTDELWRHTCFEAFLRTADGAAYYELNVSPSTEWALYSFAGYRQGMAKVAGTPAPLVVVSRAANRLQIDVELDLRNLSRPQSLALAAVIEDENARLSYWALKHPAPKPDFHHPDAFILELPE